MTWKALWEMVDQKRATLKRTVRTIHLSVRNKKCIQEESSCEERKCIQ